MTVKGRIRDGRIVTSGSLDELEGKHVLITIVDDSDASSDGYNQENDELLQLIRRCRTSSGLGDLAHQHDHYLYGTPKKP